VGGDLVGAGHLMPWRIKREVYLILLGVFALTLATIVLVLNRDIQSDLLAVLGIAGGIAIVIVSLPVNGNGNHKEDK
jgi:hypothetical protein